MHSFAQTCSESIIKKWRLFMANNTKVSLRNKVMYSIFVRNHGVNGTFKDVEEDLERIKILDKHWS